MLRALKALYIYTYQCSAASTAEEIDRVYQGAVARAAQLAQRGRTSERQLVFIDEATLPPVASQALKVLHYYLDKPRVATLMLANALLDTAKTGRMIQVRPLRAARPRRLCPLHHSRTPLTCTAGPYQRPQRNRPAQPRGGRSL